MILAIEREWGKQPGWFASLDRETRADVMADWQLRQQPPKTRTVGRR